MPSGPQTLLIALSVTMTGSRSMHFSGDLLASVMQVRFLGRCCKKSDDVTVSAVALSH